MVKRWSSVAFALVLVSSSFYVDVLDNVGSSNDRPRVEFHFGDALSLSLLLKAPQIVSSNVNTQQTPRRVFVSIVALLTLAMEAATGLGAVLFFFMDVQVQRAGICNGVVVGVMLATCFDLVQEGQKYGGDT